MCKEPHLPKKKKNFKWFPSTKNPYLVYQFSFLVFFFVFLTTSCSYLLFNQVQHIILYTRGWWKILKINNSITKQKKTTEICCAEYFLVTSFLINVKPQTWHKNYSYAIPSVSFFLWWMGYFILFRKSCLNSFIK